MYIYIYICLDERLIADLEQDHRRQLFLPIRLGVFRVELLRVTTRPNRSRVVSLVWLFCRRVVTPLPPTSLQRGRVATAKLQAQLDSQLS